MSPETKADQVERIERPNRDTFYKDYALPNKPVIISGAINEWKAISLWSVDYFKSIAGNTNIQVEVSPNRIFPPVHEQSMKRSGSYIEKSMTFGQYIDRITSESLVAEGYYFAQQPVDVLFPQLMNDIKSPDYFKEKPLSTNIWFAGAGYITPLHYDLAHNLFAQVTGRKRFILFAPEQTKLLYPFPKFSPIAHFSRVKLDDPDLVKFPRFRNARPLECTVEPGDILFIPVFWWHQVYSLNLSVSISFWSHPGWTKNLKPAAMRVYFSYVAALIWELKNLFKVFFDKVVVK